jgi:hypothetical protein
MSAIRHSPRIVIEGSVVPVSKWVGRRNNARIAEQQNGHKDTSCKCLKFSFS